MGKVLIDNGKFLTIQKGHPYFFPNCKTDNFKENGNLQYKLLTLNKSIPNHKSNPFLNYYDITKRLKPYGFTHAKFSKMFIRKDGKFYTSPIPLFLNNFSLTKENLKENQLKTLRVRNTKLKTKKLKIKQCLPLLLESSDLISNKIKGNTSFNNNLTGLKFLKYPFKKSIGIHSLTEDYLEQEVNSVYCKNGEFIEQGQTIGLLNSEKEITGDIVQGLPRIEELLEARKKKRVSKHTPKSQKKSLLIRKTTIDPNFEFRRLGSLIKENDKINPHSLLKTYFNYYAKIKYLIFNKTDSLKLHQLSNNYEASYRSFKKIQALILNSVQSVYQSQGVTIDNKHLEIIIKQMTTKVLITHEGDTPLLPREVIDLYHIKYINKVVQTQKKSKAYYVPLLLGITKAALNNPSFISAASFQETTRILTKAAIEGRLDWLRGLKENIIIGHLIPAGIGAKNYINSFNKYPITTKKDKSKSEILKIL